MSETSGGSPGIVLRRATLDDLSAVQMLLRRTWHATYDQIYGAARVAALTSRWHSIDNLKRQTAAEDATFLVATEKNVLIGTGFAEWRPGGPVHIARLYVAPESQCRGLGRMLLEQMLRQFPQARLAELEVESQNETAIAFYERMGFSLQRSLRFDGRDDTPNTLKMAKLLRTAAD